MVKPKIACYITGGWTECGYMTHFLERINNGFDYRQRFPGKNIGKKGKAKKNFKVEGTTGSKLISEVYSDMRKHPEVMKEFSAILIEDDMDDRFFLKNEGYRDYEGIKAQKAEIVDTIGKILGTREIPVFFLYALPEIEAWFVADWEDTFGLEYASKLREMNQYFSITFKRFVDKYILTGRYSAENIENYGYFDGDYRKLSDELKVAFGEYSYQEEGLKNNALFNQRINGLIRSNELGYSKTKEGINMLRRLSPNKVAAVCGNYFEKTYEALKNFTVQNASHL